MGSLPAILGLIFLFVVFASLNDRFLTTYNMANLVVQAGSICVLAMGLDLRAAARRDRPVRRRRRRRLGDDHRADAHRLRLDVVGGRCSPASPSGAVIGLAIGSLVAFLGIPSFVVTLAFFLALQAVPLKLIGSGGSLRFNDAVLRGLSIKNVPVTAGWIAAVADRRRLRRHRRCGATARCPPRAWSTSRSAWWSSRSSCSP